VIWVNNLPSIFFKADWVRHTIDCARAYSEKKGVPMTIERLAVCLSVSSRRLIEFVMGGEEPAEELKETHRLLSLAFDEIAAGHIEHGMEKGSNPSMDIFLLKSNLNYRDKPAQAGKNAVVVYFGEDALKD